MRSIPARAVVLSWLAAIVVFCVVQDRIAAAAVGQYVALKRAELAGLPRAASRPITIDSVMRPAIRRSVRHASLWALGTLAVGVTGSLVWIRAKDRFQRE